MSRTRSMSDRIAPQPQSPATAIPRSHSAVERQVDGAVIRLADGRVSDSRSLTPERVAVIRQRIENGAYDSPAIAMQVARRIVSAGEL